MANMSKLPFSYFGVWCEAPGFWVSGFELRVLNMGGLNSYLHYFGASLSDLWSNIPQSPLLIIKAPTLDLLLFRAFHVSQC